MSKKFVKHKLKENSKKIDLMRSSLFPFINIKTKNRKLRILNIYNLAQKLNHRSTTSHLEKNLQMV